MLALGELEPPAACGASPLALWLRLLGETLCNSPAPGTTASGRYSLSNLAMFFDTKDPE